MLASVVRPLVGLLLAGALAALPACDRKAPPQAAPAKAPYATFTAAAETVPLERRVDGRVESERQGNITARAAGEVLAVEHDAGDSVAAGAVVLRLRSIEQRANFAQADAALRAAAAHAVEAEARYRRIADMFGREVVSKATFESAAAARDGAVAARDAAAAGRAAALEGVAYTEVRMPYAGAITDRFVKVGEIVAVGAPLFAVAAPGALRVITDVSQELALQIRAAPRASIVADNLSIEPARITVYPRAAPESAAVRVRLDLPAEAAALLPGMFVKVDFQIGTAQRILVPRSAVIERGEVTGVYVFDPRDGGRTALRQVRLGVQRAGKVEVLAGVAVGDQVALDPVAALRSLRP